VIRLQFCFLLSKRSLGLMLFFSLALISIILYNSDFLSGYAYLDAARAENAKSYLDNSIQVIKLISVFIALFIFIQSFSKEAKQYASYLVSNAKTKLLFFNTKILAIMMIVFLFVLQQMWIFYVIGKLLTPYDFNIDELAVLFGKIYFQAIFFGMLQSLLVQMLKHNFTLIFPLTIYWFMETGASSNAVESSKLLKQMNVFLPNLLVNGPSWDFYLSFEKYIPVFMVLCLICCIVHLYQDI